ncbi:MAG: hypothetical protein ABI696_18855, partial [Rubrivivax sp.]
MAASSAGSRADSTLESVPAAVNATSARNSREARRVIGVARRALLHHPEPLVDEPLLRDRQDVVR